jgi:hypothetical protein
MLREDVTIVAFVVELCVRNVPNFWLSPLQVRPKATFSPSIKGGFTCLQLSDANVSFITLIACKHLHFLQFDCLKILKLQH